MQIAISFVGNVFVSPSWTGTNQSIPFHPPQLFLFQMQIIRRGYFTNFYPLDKMFCSQRVSLMFHRFERFSLVLGFFDFLSLTRTTCSDTNAAICIDIRWVIRSVYALSWRWISFFLIVAIKFWYKKKKPKPFLYRILLKLWQ